MNDSAPAASSTPIPVDAVSATHNAVTATEGGPAPAVGAESPAGEAKAAAPRRSRARRGKRAAPSTPATTAAAPGTPPSRTPRPVPPTLEKLAELYPQLFGAVFRPLKRGIFQDLMAAHPEVFEREALKQALGQHTRSTRYLQSVATGQQRHDLQGQPVEAMAPEHIHHALLEVYRRRQGHNNPEMTAKLCARIVANLEASGLSREDYAERVRTRDEAANALLDQALGELAEKMAREEALLRTFEASGQKTVQAFADMYGMDANTVLRALHSARSRAAKVAPAPAE
ncbi:ProQ/FINO family protein [Giesbergeria anulus]|uniref:ProQ/FINO family protein n=1 Tax=Giesbergeria anulus TaxID=180197 RepID=A0A1H9RUM4_9BURK|nr:ProQ/FINO family protein [Giesbergeria anulus]MBX9935391.1 ProQ/FINO family protein [Burkholderiaceae bacterium]SER76304.1 ProQ/FINO family protein [Giesbergeria anulus]